MRVCGGQPSARRHRPLTCTVAVPTSEHSSRRPDQRRRAAAVPADPADL